MAFATPTTASQNIIFHDGRTCIWNLSMVVRGLKCSFLQYLYPKKFYICKCNQYDSFITNLVRNQDSSTLKKTYVCAQKSLLSLLHPAIDARPLLPILATWYKNWPHPAALNLLRLLVLMIGQDLENAINHVFVELSSVTSSGERATTLYY